MRLVIWKKQKANAKQQVLLKKLRQEKMAKTLHCQKVFRRKKESVKMKATSKQADLYGL